MLGRFFRRQVQRGHSELLVEAVPVLRLGHVLQAGLKQLTSALELFFSDARPRVGLRVRWTL